MVAHRLSPGINAADKWKEDRVYVVYKQVHRYDDAGMSRLMVSDTRTVRKYDEAPSVNRVSCVKDRFLSHRK